MTLRGSDGHYVLISTKTVFKTKAVWVTEPWRVSGLRTVILSVWTKGWKAEKRGNIVLLSAEESFAASDSKLAYFFLKKFFFLSCRKGCVLPVVLY